MENLVKTKEIDAKSDGLKDRVVTNQTQRKTIKKKRKCLMCDKLFSSEGPYNRRCPSCKRLVSLGGSRNFHDPSVYKFTYKDDSNAGSSAKQTSLW